MAFSTLRVGHLRPNYPERRLVIGQVPGADYIEVDDPSRGAAHRVNQLNAFVGRTLVSTMTVNNLFWARRLPGISVLHLINSVAFGPTPWVSTFETMIPRFAGNFVHTHAEPDFGPCARRLLNRVALRAMASPRCLGLVALSECAQSIQEDFLSRCGELGERVARKVLVLPPPQAIHAASGSRDVLDAPLRLTFVGGTFARKGGREMLDALRHLREQGFRNFHLTIVSTLNVSPEATGETEAEMEALKLRLAADSKEGWLTWRPGLPNDQVLALMRETDVGLLPTHAETYGYSVLEFQSCGVPVVTTNVRAMTEINGEDRGWLIPVGRNRLGEARYDTAAQRAARSVEIREGLIAVLGGLLRDPASIMPKGIAAQERIRSRHDPKVYAERLRAIYMSNYQS